MVGQGSSGLRGVLNLGATTLIIYISRGRGKPPRLLKPRFYGDLLAF